MAVQQVRVLPLAPKPLCSPHPYHSSYQVEVQLEEPLWVPRAGPRDIAMEMMALCVQLDALILNCAHMVGEEGGDVGSQRVTFERNLTSKASAVLHQMRETLRRAGYKDDIEMYVRDVGLGYLFPRVEMFIQEPEQELERLASPLMDAYFGHLAVLNNVLTMAQQVNSDVQSCPSHKYIAHQTALLYQCIGQVGAPFSQFKKDIEGQFTPIKAACTPQEGGHPPRLPTELQQWLVEVTRRLMTDTTSLRSDLLSPLAQVLSTIQNIPVQ